ncbi:hypothetical protein [Staphylococcus arlettae]|uniref:hypothetical protein n=1 Tax=Staphylococcus arlettae TaxID=29378 RepID=UPI000E67880D|nr:hypothetical protein [Staphylococcus arlettae]RIM82348.1 hypothetical protein BU593_01155 [Staphylococcus arlettae]
MKEIFVFIIEMNDGNIFREYVENVWKIDESIAVKRFEQSIKKHHYFYLKESDRYIKVSNISTIKIEIIRNS